MDDARATLPRRNVDATFGAANVLTDAMKRLVDEQRLGYVATVCPDGTPNLSPKGTTAIWDDHLVFADIASPQTVINLQTTPLLEINVVDPLVRKGFRFKGRAEILAEGPRFQELLLFYEKRGVVNRIHHVMLVRVERALPLVSPVYALGATEGEVRARWRRYWEALENQRLIQPTGE